jgi:hypothetical protein
MCFFSFSILFKHAKNEHKQKPKSCNTWEEMWRDRKYNRVESNKQSSPITNNYARNMPTKCYNARKQHTEVS